MSTQSRVAWRSPSNIALVKYWGKRDVQLPMNPSLSFTLGHCQTTATLEWEKSTAKCPVLKSALFNGEILPAFEAKFLKFLSLALEKIPALQGHSFSVKADNNFPHSAGIASSASSMSALALCFCSMEKLIAGKKVVPSDPVFLAKASALARLGSGSASRSVYPGFVVWGKHVDVGTSNDESAVPVEVAPFWKTLGDMILIVDSSPKKITSSAGHALMEDHPFASARVKQANSNLAILLGSMDAQDFSSFADIVEEEALILHALMMSSRPGYILMKERTLTLLEKIRNLRNHHGLPVCFTLDAGPNVHLLYAPVARERVLEFISENISLLEGGRWIDDHVGNGPVPVEV